MLLLFYAPCDSSFISTQFLVLNLDGSFVVLSKSLLFFDIPLLYYYIIILILYRQIILFLISSIYIFLSLMLDHQ